MSPEEEEFDTLEERVQVWVTDTVSQLKSAGWTGEELGVEIEGDCAVFTWNTEKPPAE